MVQTIIICVLIAILVALFVLSGMKRKKFNQEMNQMRTDLKPGDKVMTDSGIVGSIVESYEDDGSKYFVLKSGSEFNSGCFSVHANAIYYVFGKENAQNEAVVEEKPVEAEVAAEESKPAKTTSKKPSNSKSKK